MESAQGVNPELFASEIQHVARAWMDAAFQRDLASCAAVLADEFTMVTDRGSLIDKSAWLANVQRRLGGEPPAFLDARVLHFGTAAVMTSRNVLRATFDGQPWTVELYLTDVWIRRDERWQIVRRHASRVMPGAD